MKSVLFFIESLDGGGAEASLTNYAKLSQPHDLTYTVFSEEQYPASAVPHRFFVTRKKTLLDKIKVKFSLIFPKKLVAFVMLRKRYDLQVAFCEGFATQLIAASPFKGKKVAWVHTDVINNPWSEKILGGREKERACYEKMDAIVCVSETMRKAFIEKYGMTEKIHVLYNVYDEANILSMAAEPVEKAEKRPVFTMAGRLVPVKGYDRLIRVTARLKQKGYAFTVQIMGRGEQEAKLKKLVEEYGLTDEIRFLGFQSNPYKYIAKSDAFLCSSLAEGYSTSVSEAIMLGIPVITTECSGMKEIFGESRCGIICENSEEGFFAALESVLAQPELLKSFAEQAAERAGAFSMQERLNQIEAFLTALADS